MVSQLENSGVLQMSGVIVNWRNGPLGPGVSDDDEWIGKEYEDVQFRW